MRRVLLIASILTSSLVGQANASIIVIPQPDAAYQAAMSKIDVASVPNRTSLSSITDGTLTVSFDTPLNKRTVPVNWSSWSSPPDAESATPAVLYDSATSLTMSLSRPVTIFGFELEPAPFSTESFDVDFVFLNGPTVVGTLSLSANGRAGARLFAAASQDLPFDQIVINGTSDFAIGQVRYNLSPSCASATASPNRLWPPNHKFVPITISGIVNPVPGAVTISVTSIFQDEPTSGASDATGVGTGHPSVRSERDGGGDGRVYHINFTATGASGSCTGSVTVGVPHDQGHGSLVDGGSLYNSTTP
jgi:hypothetical protein